MIQRIITAIVLIALVLTALFYAPADTWFTWLLLVGGVAMFEWGNFTKSDTVEKVIFTGAMVAASWLMISYFNLYVFIFLVLAQFYFTIKTVHTYQNSKAESLGLSENLIKITGLLSVVNFIIAMFYLRESFSPEWILLSMVLIWSIDSGAYFSGRALGKNKLAVHVSPGKTWEGVIGGFLLTLFAAYFISQSEYVPEFTSALIVMIIFSVIALLSVYGDLFESVLKRNVGLKDSGKILPGHGGVLDRIDSLLIALPLMLIVSLTFQV